MGEIPDADQVSELTGTCGDTMRIWLKIEDGVIRDARYQVLGCPGAVAAAMRASRGLDRTPLPTRSPARTALTPLSAV